MNLLVDLWGFIGLFCAALAVCGFAFLLIMPRVYDKKYIKEIELLKELNRKQHKAWWQIAREIVQVEQANKLLRKASGEIYEQGFRDAYGEISKQLIKDSPYLKSRRLLKEKEQGQLAS